MAYFQKEELPLGEPYRNREVPRLAWNPKPQVLLAVTAAAPQLQPWATVSPYLVTGIITSAPREAGIPPSPSPCGSRRPVDI